jgi:hypothetical protein
MTKMAARRALEPFAAQLYAIEKQGEAAEQAEEDHG